jgi:hypothetical protein
MIYLHDWSAVDVQVRQADGHVTWHERPATEAESREAMLRDFEVEASALDDATVLLASYTYEDYSGAAFVLFERGGTLYRVEGSHCSCMGLEGQWEPEETSLAALAHEINHGWVSNDYRDELCALLAQMGAPVVAKTHDHGQ